MGESRITVTPPKEDVFGNRVSVDPSRSKEVITFYGACHALRLVHRGPDDNHICIELLTEDDGHWFTSGDGSWGSSAWLPDIIALAGRAQRWMLMHCEPDMHQGVQYGYKEK